MILNMATEDFFKGGLGKGIAIGIGAALLAPVVLPVLAKAGRPLARAAIKSGILLFEKGRETVAELGEVAEDLIAEAQAEIEEETVQEVVEEVAESAGEVTGEATVES